MVLPPLEKSSLTLHCITATSFCFRANSKKIPLTLAESSLISTEESIMATFDFLAGENVIDEESLSDGETEDASMDEDLNDDQLIVKKTKKVRSHVLYSDMNSDVVPKCMLFSS